MRPHASLAVVIVAAAVLLSGCGETKAELAEGVTTIAAETTVPDEDPSSPEWNRYPGKVLSVELPSSWAALGYDVDVPKELETEMGREAVAQIESGRMLYAIDMSPEALERFAAGKLVATFSVLEADQPPTSWAQFVRVNSRPPERATRFEWTVTKLAIGRALEVTWAHGGGPLNEDVVLRQYFLLPEPDRVIAVTMETTPELFEEQSPLFEEIARRLRKPSR